MMNPRPPAAPATLDLTLGEYYAAAAAMGALAAQMEQPDTEWIQEWALDFGEGMAAKAVLRRRRGRRSRKR